MLYRENKFYPCGVGELKFFIFAFSTEYILSREQILPQCMHCGFGELNFLIGIFIIHFGLFYRSACTVALAT